MPDPPRTVPTAPDGGDLGKEAVFCATNQRLEMLLLATSLYPTDLRSKAQVQSKGCYSFPRISPSHPYRRPLEGSLLD